MYKNRIRGLQRRTSRQLTTKSISIKDAGGKSGGRVSKAAELIAGDLRHVADSRPAYQVVWQGRVGDHSPYADLIGLYSAEILSVVGFSSPIAEPVQRRAVFFNKCV